MNPPSSDRVTIFDTTLRDGEQSPGCSMTRNEKVALGRELARLGVDVIEAGFPAASPGDFESVRAVSAAVSGPVIAALARARSADIETAAQALAPAGRGRIHTFISTSPLHMAEKLHMTPDRVLEAVAESVRFARQFTDDVEWSAEDASRSEGDFLCRCVESAIENGATTINIPDTVGYATPQEYGELFTMLKNRVPNMDLAVLSVHCHNDLGMAMANSLAGVGAGARQVECTLSGIGERAGNAALEEIVMAIRTRPDRYPYVTGIDPTRIVPAARQLYEIIGQAPAPNKAIIGANAFAHESGIHQDGMLKNPLTYEIMTPESVGWARSELILGKHSGRHAFARHFETLGCPLAGDALEDAFSRFKTLCDQKKRVGANDLLALVEGASSVPGGPGAAFAAVSKPA